MGAMANEGRTVLFVSHNMIALQTLCSRAIWLSSGEIKADLPAQLAVSEYLHVTAKTMLYRTWDEKDTNAASSVARLLSARVLAARPEHMTIAEPFDIEVDFANFISGASLHVTVHIHTVEGIHVLTSPAPAQSLERGRVTARCRIPGNLMNDGSYSIHIMIVRDMSVVEVNCTDAIFFELYDAARPMGWYGKWPGVVRPDLEWEVCSHSGGGEPVQPREQSINV
jgi:lipopolysaccharide transport system ATP-binding protein